MSIYDLEKGKETLDKYNDLIQFQRNSAIAATIVMRLSDELNADPIWLEKASLPQKEFISKSILANDAYSKAIPISPAENVSEVVETPPPIEELP